MSRYVVDASVAVKWFVPEAHSPEANVEGFDLHANVWVGAHDRARLEQLCRYLLRPPLADDRLRLRSDGRGCG